LVRAAVSYERHMHLFFESKLCAGLAADLALPLLPHFIEVPGEILKSQFAAVSSKQSEQTPVRPMFLADGAMAFLVWCAARHWKGKQQSKKIVLYDLLADTQDKSSIKDPGQHGTWYSMTRILLDESLGIGTVKRFWRNYGWMNFILMEDGWPWSSVFAPGVALSKSLKRRSADENDLHPSPMRQLIKSASAADAKVPLLRSLPTAVAVPVPSEDDIRKRAGKLPIVKRDAPQLWQLKPGESAVMHEETKKYPHFHWPHGGLPPAHSGSPEDEEILKLVRGNAQLLYAMRPTMMEGSSPFWCGTRANLLLKVAKDLKMSPMEIERVFNHRSPSTQGGQLAIDAAECAIENPIFDYISTRLNAQRQLFRPTLLDKAILITGKSGAGKTFNLSLSVLHCVRMLICNRSNSHLLTVACVAAAVAGTAC
jgi:hypothetical protein